MALKSLFLMFLINEIFKRVMGMLIWHIRIFFILSITSQNPLIYAIFKFLAFSELHVYI